MHRTQARGNVEKVMGPWDPERLQTLEPSARVDAVGLFCPLPVVKTAERMKQLPIGAILCLLADDPGVVLDITAWCRSTRNELLGIFRDAEGVFHCYVRKTNRLPGEDRTTPVPESEDRSSTG